MDFGGDFELYNWIFGNAHLAKTAILASSATPALSVDDICNLSSDTKRSRDVLSLSALKLPLASDRGSQALRQNIADTFQKSSNIAADNVIVCNGTSGTNHVLQRSLLRKGDHVVVTYPSYGPLIEEPKDIGCDITYWRHNEKNGWKLDLNELSSLLRKDTKLLIVNHPNNPTGAHLDRDTQRGIIKIAKQHNVSIHADEIFFPLFYDSPPSTETLAQGTEHEIVPSFNDHADLEYDKIVTTCSLSKVYGLSGVRIGWLATRSTELYQTFIKYRLFAISACSTLDETVATEVLSSRVRPGILKRHLDLAQTNLELYDAFVEKHSAQVKWVRPTASGIGFMNFRDATTGQPVDDVEFCRELVRQKGVLISPGSMCFGIASGQRNTKEKTNGHTDDDFKGWVRIHLTAPTDVVKTGLQGLSAFLDEKQSSHLAMG